MRLTHAVYHVAELQIKGWFLLGNEVSDVTKATGASRFAALLAGDPVLDLCGGRLDL